MCKRRVFEEDTSDSSHDGIKGVRCTILLWLTMLLLSHFSRVLLCDPIDGSPPGSPIPGTLQARTLEWVAISFSNAWRWKVKVKSLSRAQLPATPWTAAHQTPPSMGISRQEYWSGVPLPSPLPWETHLKKKKILSVDENNKCWQRCREIRTLIHY